MRGRVTATVGHAYPLTPVRSSPKIFRWLMLQQYHETRVSEEEEGEKKKIPHVRRSRELSPPASPYLGTIAPIFRKPCNIFLSRHIPVALSHPRDAQNIHELTPLSVYSCRNEFRKVSLKKKKKSVPNILLLRSCRII